MAVRFEWDLLKAEQNLRRHGVSFGEAATVFLDALSVEVPDPAHSGEEDREIAIGWSSQSRLLVVVHTETPGSIRIISARMATRSERRFYES